MGKRRKAKKSLHQKSLSIAVTTKPKKAYGKTWYPPPGLFVDDLKLEIDKLAELQETVTTAIAKAKTELEAAWAKLKGDHEWDDEAAEWVADDWYGVDEQERWAILLHIVAVYHTLEHEVGSVIRWRISGMPDAQQEELLFQVHKWRGLEELLDKLCKVQLSAISRYSDVNELRVLANSVKHTGGHVSKELATLTGRTRGDQIAPASINAEALRNAALEFMRDLVVKVEAGTQALLGTPP